MITVIMWERNKCTYNMIAKKLKAYEKKIELTSLQTIQS